ncbi:MAG TPA: HD-GYP domain-containing protein [Candidatus Saccharimonadaceae bacterium]|jgi:putative nucleotidyltransferase with HDIG domain|nr:HD-GYP domain-containing protein [Candidatus Saccharimonadaceae bacterium]
MTRKRIETLWRINRGLGVLLGIVLITGTINFFVINQRAFLNFYYLPVVFGAYTMGLRKGVYSALLSCAIVFGIALANESQFGGTSDPEAWMRWLDLGTWACFLVLTSYIVGSLYEEKESQFREIRDAYQGIIQIMSKFIDSVDRYTENHSRRVADYAVEIGRTMGLSEGQVEDVRVGAYLHDIGKVDISTEVLRKAAGLTDDEMVEMRRHVDKGETMVRSMGGILKHVIPMVAYHHERWDGTGYKGLKGDEIPLGARIIAVADTYDAIVIDRAYRKGRTHAEAVKIIRDESGTQFDPAVVAVFLQLYAADAGEPDADEAQAA